MELIIMKKMPETFFPKNCLNLINSRNFFSLKKELKKKHLKKFKKNVKNSLDINFFLVLRVSI